MRLTPASCLPAGLLLAAPALLAAQPAAVAADPVVPATIDACYVPASGTIYRIDTPASPAAGAPKACLSASHVKFTWNQQGPAGPAGPPGPRGDQGAPGTAANLGPDLALPGALSMGKTGTFGGGLLATGANPLVVPSGGGIRFAWIPQRAALRAGEVDASQWNLENVGNWSTALGRNNHAPNAYAIAIGNTNYAGGLSSVALGGGNAASGTAAVAIGDGNVANALHSVALGFHASANGKAGTFVYGDNSTETLVAADAENQFLVRAAGGVKLRTTADLSKGCNVDGAGNLACTGTVTGTNTGGAPLGPDLDLPGKLTMGKTGTFGGGLLATGANPLAIPSGAGVRLMWIPQRVAFRAGSVSGTEWNETSVGSYSVAMGKDVRASSQSTVALGEGVVASGANSVALGQGASTNEKAGAFVYGDNSTTTAITAEAENEFAVRAAGGVRLRTSSNLSKGCNVDGQGNLHCTGTVTGATAPVQRVIGSWSTVDGAQSKDVGVDCPANTMLVGGGVETKNGDIKVRQSYPNSNNFWFATVRNDNPYSTGEARAYALCFRQQ